MPREITLLTPLEAKPYTTEDRRERAQLLQDPELREVFILRKTTVEPYQWQLKNLSGLEQLPMKGLRNVRTLCTLATLAYCLLVSLNLKLARPPLQLKATRLAL